MAVNELGQSRELAERQWSAAVRAQTDAERELEQLGKAALELAIAANKPAIVLAGHSYNAFTPEASQSVGKKLSSMGVAAIPADCLTPEAAGPTSWHFANQVMNAVKIVKQQPNLFLLCVSNFSCTIDAFTQSMLGFRDGLKTLSDSRDRRPHRRRRRANPPGSISRYRQKLSSGPDQPLQPNSSPLD